VSDLQDTIAWAEAHKPDILLIMVTNTLTSNTRDWLKSIESEKRYRVLLYEEKNFEQFFDRNEDIYAKYFPKERITPRRSVIALLLNDQEYSFDSIVAYTKLPPVDIEEILTQLQKNGILSKTEVKGVRYFRITSDIMTFIAIAQEFLITNNRFDFLRSDYATHSINEQLLDYVSSRYHLTFPQQYIGEFVKLLRISPSALNAALFSSTDVYDTSELHMTELHLDAEGSKRMRDSLLSTFFLMLFEGVITDLRDPNAANILVQNHVEGYDLTIKINMASQVAPVLRLQVENIFMLMSAAGPIKAGQLVSPTDPDVYLRSGNILFHLGLAEAALQQYDIAIQNLTDKRKLAGAWNNKGVCFKNLGRIPESKQCFQTALDLDPSLEEARKNME
jgi:tetratricopeptide (TPR) repeat protein